MSYCLYLLHGFEAPKQLVFLVQAKIIPKFGNFAMYMSYAQVVHKMYKWFWNILGPISKNAWLRTWAVLQIWGLTLSDASESLVLIASMESPWPFGITATPYDNILYEKWSFFVNNLSIISDTLDKNFTLIC